MIDLGALFFALAIVAVSELLRRIIPGFQKYKIPRALIGGLLALLLGPQVFGKLSGLSFIDQELLSSWDQMTLPFVNIIFASLFIGQSLPSFRSGLRLALPQAALGQTMAWGQYFVGSLTVYFVLEPFFSVSPAFASLIELSFQGGIGAAVGLKETFASLGAPEGAQVAVLMAPLAMLSGILVGLVLINLRQRNIRVDSEPNQDAQELKKSDEHSSAAADNAPPEETKTFKPLWLQFLLLGVAISVGWGILNSLLWAEESFIVGVFYANSLIKHVPLFPMALLGGLVLQLFLGKLKWKFADQKIQTAFGSMALDLVVVMALGNLELAAIGQHWPSLLILFGVGVAWNLFCFLILARLLIPKFWFQRGIADFGQSMGTTSIGLMLLKIVDPKNKTQGQEAFGIKQVFFEPLLGGGIITSVAPILAVNLGLPTFAAVSGVLATLVFVLGLLYSRRVS